MTLKKFATLRAAAVRRKGEEGLAKLLPQVKTPAALKKVSDDRALSLMAKELMRAGFYWKVVESKWPAIEELLHGFDPRWVSQLNGIEIAELLDDERMIRHRKKLLAIAENAVWVAAIAEEHQSFGRYVANWPPDNIVELWAQLRKSGARLGGRTGARFLRSLGKDTFLLTPDVVAVLNDSEVFDCGPSSQRGQRLAQNAFNQWREECGLPLAHISKIVSCSVAHAPSSSARARPRSG